MISQISQNFLTIVHLVFNDISTAGSPANMVYEFLRGFFKDSNCLRFEEIKFDLKGVDDIEIHNDRVASLADDLSK